MERSHNNTSPYTAYDPSDPHSGGKLQDMAPTGTHTPGDAGLQNTTVLPSIARPSQRAEHRLFDNQGLGAPDLATAADNATDVPRSTRDAHASHGVITGTGDVLPPEVETKRCHFGGHDPGAKGDPRGFKHAVKTKSYFDRFAGEDRDATEKIGEHAWRNDHV
ncbi:hypothetical protein VTN02DRAFT_445 [Thermoascus thermophilus]